MSCLGGDMLGGGETDGHVGFQPSRLQLCMKPYHIEKSCFDF